jgi:DNA-directed RNA polymerase subunit omega
MKDDTTLVNEVLDKIPNKYMAVIVASKRARAINDGIRPLIKTDAKKPTTIAMEEIAEGVIIPALESKKLEIEAPEEELDEEEPLVLTEQVYDESEDSDDLEDDEE